MENIKFNEEMKNKINSLIGFVSSITANLDDDFTIEDGITISEGWDIFVQLGKKIYKENFIMGEYEVSVMGLESYKVEAESEEEAITKAMDCFADDDMYYGTEEADKVTEEDCYVMWFEEY